MKWSDVLPEYVSKQQDRWERRHRLYLAWQAGGVTQREIAGHLGVTKARVQHLIKMAASEVKLKQLSPVERYFAGRFVGFADLDRGRVWATRLVECDENGLGANDRRRDQGRAKRLAAALEKIDVFRRVQSNEHGATRAGEANDV